ncbi:MAG: guanine deaminase [Burkholderiales bacterium]|nr:guanine deaminase [Burkholderiales bacterium]
MTPDAAAAGARVSAFRGEVLHFLRDPGDAAEPAGGFEYFADGVLVVRDGLVAEVGPALDVLARLPARTPVVDRSGKLLLPGFVDCHIHYPQTDVIASYGEQLLEWLEKYTYPAERAFADAAHAGEAAQFFLDELARNGTTTALVLGTVHPQSVEAFFSAARARGMRMIAGKCLMDRNCPESLRDTAERGYAESRALIERWHGRDRLLYAITPRFAASSTEAQLARAGALAAEVPDVFVHSHLAENRAEVAWVRELFPWARSYLDVYVRHGLVRPRSVFAHCLHLDEEDRALMGERGALAAFCPTSNLFLGSGLFDLRAADRAGIAVGIATDVGGGTSFSMLRTLAEAYKVAQLTGQPLSAHRAFYLATLGGARGLGLDERIGSFAPGREADFVVLDPAATPLAARRIACAPSLAERLFALMMLGDDRFVAETYVLGRRAHARPA